MTTLQTFLFSSLNWIEIFAALTAIIYYKSVKNSYWKWFVYYLISIAFLEFMGKFIVSHYKEFNTYYYDYLVIPLEFIFLYWLYSKSLLKIKLFYIFTTIYVVSFLPHLFYSFKLLNINSLSYTIGNFIMLIFVFLEFKKQIKTDEILLFKQNRMFYINCGVIIFYVGTLPLFTFYDYLAINLKDILSYYYTFFLLANCILYLLFATSFICGKQNL